MSRYNCHFGRVITGRESGSKKIRRPVHYLHYSAILVHRKNADTGLRETLIRKPGRTYRAATPNVRQTRQVRRARKAAKRAAACS